MYILTRHEHQTYGGSSQNSCGPQTTLADLYAILIEVRDDSRGE